MKTSYYQSKKIDPAKHQVIQISRSASRFGARPEWEIDVLAPDYSLQGLSENSFAKAYCAALDKIGVSTIRTELAQVQADPQRAGRDTVLCCFESLKSRDQFCHRRMFAQWWFDHTGETIPEL